MLEKRRASNPFWRCWPLNPAVSWQSGLSHRPYKLRNRVNGAVHGSESRTHRQSQLCTEINRIATKESAYTGLVAESLKVPADQFKAVIRALLNTPPTPQADMPKKPKAAKPSTRPRSQGK